MLSTLITLLHSVHNSAPAENTNASPVNIMPCVRSERVGWPNEYSAHLPFWEIGESEGHGFESGTRRFETWSSQTKDFKIDTCRFLAWCSALIG